MRTDEIDNATDDDLANLSDADLGDVTADAILNAAVMNGSRWADSYHDRVDRLYAECARRGRGIYQRAWNDVARSQGHGRLVTPVTEGGA